MPTLGFHVPDESPLAQAVREQATALRWASVSAYVRSLVERDLAGGGSADAMSPTIMVDLTRELAGRLDAAVMAQALKDIDQREALRLLLLDWLGTVARRDPHLAVAEGADLNAADAASDRARARAEAERTIYPSRKRSRRADNPGS